MTRLLNQRKYIFAVHEVTTRLAYIGVLQFGPQKLKEKDQVLSYLLLTYHLILSYQVFLYLNRKSSIVDTTSSCPGYHQAGGNILPKFITFSLSPGQN